jgi:hypothetical protein
MTSQNAIITIVIILFVIARFLMRELRERHLSTAQLFIFPAIIGCGWAYLAYAASTASHVDGIDLGVRTVIALGFGIVVGVLVAHFTTVRIGTDGKVFFRGSYVTVAIWIVALVLRTAARFAFPAERGSMSAALSNAESLVLLAFVATVVVRILVLRKARDERRRAHMLTETAV